MSAFPEKRGYQLSVVPPSTAPGRAFRWPPRSHLTPAMSIWHSSTNWAWNGACATIRCRPLWRCCGRCGSVIGIHPDDPPVPVLGGVPRPIFSNFPGYKRALEIADSLNVGMCLCVGCWLEGGRAMVQDVMETIRYFGSRKKIFKVHFRNVTKPIPEGGFTETYPDAGYMDMHLVMRALREVSFDGGLMSDHLPQMVGGYYAAEAYHVGYIKALVQAVNNEFGGPPYTP